jgi:uncharacterized phage protein (TIGR02216 family)
MAAGFGQLRLSPRALWSMTPREFVAALQAVPPTAITPMTTRQSLTALIHRFPDR